MSIIKDPSLAPFYIGKDAYCYTVYEIVKPKENHHLKKSGVNKVYEKPLGHYKNLGSALKAVANAKLTLEDKTYESVKDYLKEWEHINKETEKLFNTKDL